MATVFLVMAGGSALLVRGRGRHAPNASVVVTQQGEPLVSPVPPGAALVALSRSRPDGVADGGGFDEFEKAVSSAEGAFVAGRYEEAKGRFEVIAPRDSRGVLGGARVARQLQGCTAAIAGFLQAEAAGRGTVVEWDARVEIATCFRKLGEIDSAVRELTPLLAVPGYRDRARVDLESLGAQARTKPSSPPR